MNNQLFTPFLRRRLRPPVEISVFLFSCMLFLSAGAAGATEVNDNAAWMEQVIQSRIELPDSLVAGQKICIREASAQSLGGIVRQSLVEALSQKEGALLCGLADSCNTLLEFQILTMQVKFVPLPSRRVFREKNFFRCASFDIRLQLYAGEDRHLIWSGALKGEEKQEIPRRDAEKTKSRLYSDLNDEMNDSIWPKALDAAILLGASGVLIYFLYR